MISAALFILQGVNGGWANTVFIFALIALYSLACGTFSKKQTAWGRVSGLLWLAAALLAVDAVLIPTLFPGFRYKNLGMKGVWTAFFTPILCLGAASVLKRVLKRRNEERKRC